MQLIDQTAGGVYFIFFLTFFCFVLFSSSMKLQALSSANGILRGTQSADGYGFVPTLLWAERLTKGNSSISKSRRCFIEGCRLPLRGQQRGKGALGSTRDAASPRPAAKVRRRR